MLIRGQISTSAARTSALIMGIIHHFGCFAWIHLDPSVVPQVFPASCHHSVLRKLTVHIPSRWREAIAGHHSPLPMSPCHDRLSLPPFSPNVYLCSAIPLTHAVLAFKSAQSVLMNMMRKFYFSICFSHWRPLLSSRLRTKRPIRTHTFGGSTGEASSHLHWWDEMGQLGSLQGNYPSQHSLPLDLWDTALVALNAHLMIFNSFRQSHTAERPCMAIVKLHRCPREHHCLF